MTASTVLEARHDRGQDRLLLASLVVLAGMTIEALQLIPPDSSLHWVSSLVRLLGWTSFAVIWFWLARLVRDDSSNLMTAPVVDERVRLHRAEASRTALTVVLALQLVILLSEKLITLRQADTAGLTLAVAQVAMLYDFRRRSRQ